MKHTMMSRNCRVLWLYSPWPQCRACLSHCTFNSLENMDDGPTDISTGWVEHSNSSGTWSVPRSVETCLSTPKVWEAESMILKLIFSKRSLGSTALHVCKNKEHSKLQLREVLFALTGYGQCWKRTKFSIFGTPSTIDDPNPFVFEPSLWYVMQTHLMPLFH